MLQLSVQKGLKQCKAIYRRVKTEGDVQSPLDLLTDVKMRWNSTYLTWKRLLKLHNSIRFISTSLLFKSDHAFQKESKKLEHLCLSVREKESDKNKTVDTYLKLVYGKGYKENDDVKITDDDIPDASTR
ncbi:19343_t:CDS:2 [Rhizophagus irregularis]|nr:19343_t:CDS:2 [Rhizophagus irregularis]